MSTHVYPVGPGLSAPEIHAHIVRAARAPESLVRDDAAITVSFAPDLTSVEATALDGLMAALAGLERQHVPGITLDEWRSIQPDLAALRTFRQTTSSEFMALTAAQRDRATFAAVQGIIAVLRALLRD